MKKIFNTILRSVSAALLLASTLLVGRANAIPGANTVYLTPSSSSVQNGDTVAVSIWVNASTLASGGNDGIDGIDTTVNFTTSQLQYVSVDASGSAFSQSLAQTASGSSVHIIRALGLSEPFLTGNVFVAKVNLKALAGSGSTAVTLSSTNTTHGSSYTNPATQNTSVTLTTAAATCPSGQVGTPPNCTTPTTGGGSGGTSGGSSGGSTSGGSSKTTTSSSGSSSSTNSGASTTPAADDTIQASIGNPEVQYSIASLTATSKVPTQAYIQFGTSKDGLTQQTTPDAFATSHSLSIDSSLLTPGMTYFYTVVAKDQSGNVSQTSVQSFTTKGLTLTVVIFDKNHKPLAKQKLTLHSTPQTATTDANGVATFNNVQPGDHEALYEAGGKTYSQSINVQNNVKSDGGKQTSATQNFSVVYSGYKQSSVSAVVLAGGVVVVIAVLGGLGFFGMRFRKGGIAAPAVSPMNTGSVTVMTPASAPLSAPNDSENLIDHVNGLDKPAPGNMITPNGGSGDQQPHDPNNPSQQGGL